MRILVALTVATALPCFASSSQLQKSCEDAGGRCVKSNNATGDCTVLSKYKCPCTSHVCCRIASPDVRFTNSKVWTCEESSKCLRKQGKCIPKADLSLCPASSYKRRKLCGSHSCLCCIEKKNKKKCTPRSKCSAKDGFCFSRKEGNACVGGRVLKGGCKGNCACCIPAGSVQCSQSPRCASLHGSCIAKKSKHTCMGAFIKKVCLKKGCICCVPGKPPPVTVTPSPVTTPPPITTTLPPVTTTQLPVTTTQPSVTTTQPPLTTTPTPVITTSVVTATTTTGGCRCGIINERRIVGGVQVEPMNKYPWVVGFDVIGNSSYDCAGNIINDRYILTAAHCLFNPNTLQRLPLSDLQVGIADHDQFSTTDDVPGVTRRVGVQEVIIFENFSIVNVDFDIALLKLQQPLDLTVREVGPICLPANDDQTYGGNVGTAVGWGDTSEGGVQPAILREVDVPILEKATCESMMINFFTITDTMICAGTQEGGKDACQGDSGGPLSVVQGEQHVLVGVSAFGDGCAKPGIPGVYSRVSKYLQWIRNNTQDAIYCS